MSYLVLARKYRPQSFDELTGQEHISDLIKNAIESERIAHAYLFCGPRGIGKTSCARILSKALNCEKGPTVKPCGECSACREITQGNSFDVLEIDGASNRGIDEIRALRENVKFAPSYGRYKIYIVDEVHMLTTEAFNALLKTLEEPPEHVKFIFATTAPSKLPSTIVSRCQRFDFKRISVKVIGQTLEAISQKEKFQIDQDALFAISKAAKGSLRDALSILDQISAFSRQGIKAEDVYSMLGLVETELLFELTDAVAQKNCTAALKILDRIIDKGKDIKQLVKDVTEHFRNLMIIKVGGRSLGKLVDYPVAVKEMILTQCEQFKLSEILKAIDVFIGVQDSSRITESMRMPLEVAIAKLTYAGERPGAAAQGPVTASATPIAQRSQPAEFPDAEKDYGSMGNLKSKKGQVDISGSSQPEEEIPAPDVEEASVAVAEMEPVESTPPENIVNGSFDIEKVRRTWDALTHAVGRQKMSAATYLQEAVPVEVSGSKIVIGFPKRCSFNKEVLEDNANKQMLEDVFSEKLNCKVLVDLVFIDDPDSHAIEDQGIVKVALDKFNGKVIQRWHND